MGDGPTGGGGATGVKHLRAMQTKVSKMIGGTVLNLLYGKFYNCNYYVICWSSVGETSE